VHRKSRLAQATRAVTNGASACPQNLGSRTLVARRVELQCSLNKVEICSYNGLTKQPSPLNVQAAGRFGKRYCDPCDHCRPFLPSPKPFATTNEVLHAQPSVLAKRTASRDMSPSEPSEFYRIFSLSGPLWSCDAKKRQRRGRRFAQ